MTSGAAKAACRARAHHFWPFTAHSKTTPTLENRTAAAKSRHFNNLCGTGKPVPFVGSGSHVELLGAYPDPVFISLGEPKAHRDTAASRALMQSMSFSAARLASDEVEFHLQLSLPKPHKFGAILTKNRPYRLCGDDGTADSDVLTDGFGHLCGGRRAA